MILKTRPTRRAPKLNRRELLAALPAGALMLHAAPSFAGAPNTPRLLIGTSGRGSKGIYTANFHDGHITNPTLAAELPNPSFLALSPTHFGTLFAISETDADAVATAFNVVTSSDAPGVSLGSVGHASSGGPGGCHISATKDGTSVFVANYTGGSAASFKADAQGRLSQASFIAFPPAGHGPVPDRQTQSHAHSALVSPDGSFVLVNDLGLDCIHVFRLDKGTAKLTPNTPAQWKAQPGSGPRHLAMHPNGKWIYNINELSSTVDHLEWNSTHGVLTAKQHISTLPRGMSATGKAACELVFSKDHRFLYASNRFFEDFAVFSVDPGTGTLSLVQHRANPGKQSRHIAIDPTGRFFLSANQFSDEISVFPIDTSTGQLGERISTVPLGAPSCLLFA